MDDLIGMLVFYDNLYFTQVVPCVFVCYSIYFVFFFASLLLILLSVKFCVIAFVVSFLLFHTNFFVDNLLIYSSFLHLIYNG